MVTTSITILRFPSVFRNSEPRLWLASKQYCRLKMQTSCYSKVIIILAFILVHSVELQNFKENPVNNIILLESKNAPPYAQYMYKNLHNVFNRFKIKFEIIYRSRADVETTIKITKLNRNSIVINIYVDDFYKTNYDEILNDNLLYAGDIDLNTSTLLINNGVIRNRNYVTESQPARKIAKLMTANIARMKELEQYIIGFPNKKLSIDIDKKPNKVLICLNKFNVYVKHVLHFSDDIGLNLIYSDKCEEDIRTHKETILAVLTPKQIESDLASPIIIYENSQQDYYDSSNVFNLVNVKKSMEFFEIGFKSFLKETYWNRVAVISDTWAYSLMFQDMLTTMFKNEGILHTALECFENVHGIIDFKPALRKLRAADAGIVIVNIDKRNGMQLAKQVQQVMKLNGIVWVSRDWPFKEDVSTSMGSVISLSLTPANVYKLQDNIDGIHTKRIFTLVNLVARAYKNTAHVPNSIMKKDFYRKITAELKTSIRNGDIVVYITKMLGDRYPKTVGKVSIEKRGAIVFETHLNRELERISNDAQWCFRGNDYYKPCNNTVFIHIMLVLIVFALMMLAILFIFSKINENRNAYKRMCE